MHLAIPLTLYMGSFAAAAPSFQHAQISVEVTHTNFQNQADALHSSGKPVMNEDAPPFSHLPFNFTLIARNVHGTLRLPFGFADLTLADGLARGELGYATEFALHDRKLINGNRGLAYHEAKILPPWTSLWTFDKPHRYLEFAAIPNPSEKGEQYVLEFAASPAIFGVDKFREGEPVFIAPPYYGKKLILEIKPISNDDINADSTEKSL